MGSPDANPPPRPQNKLHRLTYPVPTRHIFPRGSVARFCIACGMWESPFRQAFREGLPTNHRESTSTLLCNEAGRWPWTSTAEHTICRAVCWLDGKGRTTPGCPCHDVLDDGAISGCKSLIPEWSPAASYGNEVSSRRRVNAPARRTTRARPIWRMVASGRVSVPVSTPSARSGLWLRRHVIAQRTITITWPCHWLEHVPECEVFAHSTY